MDGKRPERSSGDDGSPLWATNDWVHWGIAIMCLVITALALICGNLIK